MTSAADLSHAVLIRVADFLRTLPPEQLAALADGTAQLTVATATAGPQQPAAPAPAPARRSRAKAAKPAVVVDTDRIRADLAAIDDRVAAGRYLDDLGLKVAELRALATELGVALPSRATKAVIQKNIVQATVGRRLTSAVLSRPASSS